MGIVGNPVEYDVGDDGVGENGAPISEGAIAGQDQGFGRLSGFYNGVKELGGLLGYFFQRKVVDDQEIGATDFLKQEVDGIV